MRTIEHVGVFFLSRVSAAAAVVAVMVPVLFFVPGVARPDRPVTAALIEVRIFELLNAERESRGLGRLELSRDLAELARGHSRDMARTGSLSHESSSGKSLGERLTDSGFFFEMGGENVAFSETFVSEFIHKALMDSPEHRGEILRPEYDRVGIGVAYAAGKGYYLTQDFIRSLIPVSAGEAEAELKRRINEARAAKGLDSLVFVPEADAVARSYSVKKAGLGTPPPVAKLLGEVTIDFVTAGTLDLDSIKPSGVRSSAYEEAGLGIWFGRDGEHPGGGYFITLLLFKKDPYRRMKRDELRSAALAAVNKARRRAVLPELELDARQSKTADQTSEEILRGTWKPPAAPTFRGQIGRLAMTLPKTIGYIVDDLSLIPPPIETDVLKIQRRKIGIGIARGKSDTFPRGAYWVTIVYQ